MKVAVLLTALLAGCASQPQGQPILTPEVAQQMSAMDLCRGTLYFRPINAQTAREEASRRGLDCTALYGAVQADEASRRAAAVQLMQNQPPVYQPQPAYQLPMPAPRQQINCESYRVGNSVQTNCR